MTKFYSIMYFLIILIVGLLSFGECSVSRDKYSDSIIELIKNDRNLLNEEHKEIVSILYGIWSNFCSGSQDSCLFYFSCPIQYTSVFDKFKCHTKC